MRSNVNRDEWKSGTHEINARLGNVSTMMIINDDDVSAFHRWSGMYKSLIFYFSSCRKIQSHTNVLKAFTGDSAHILSLQYLAVLCCQCCYSHPCVQFWFIFLDSENTFKVRNCNLFLLLHQLIMNQGFSTPLLISSSSFSYCDWSMVDSHPASMLRQD